MTCARSHEEAPSNHGPRGKGTQWSVKTEESHLAVCEFNDFNYNCLPGMSPKVEN